MFGEDEKFVLEHVKPEMILIYKRTQLESVHGYSAVRGKVQRGGVIWGIISVKILLKGLRPNNHLERKEEKKKRGRDSTTKNKSLKWVQSILGETRELSRGQIIENCLCFMSNMEIYPVCNRKALQNSEGKSNKKRY